MPAVSASACLVSAGGVHFALCDEKYKSAITNFKRTKTSQLSEDQKVLMKNSKLMEGFKYKHGEEKVPLTEEDVADVLLGCGVLDRTIVKNTYDTLMNYAQEQAKKKKNMTIEDDKVPFKTFMDVCALLSIGSDEQKFDFVFDFIDTQQQGLIDKYEISKVVRHLLFCRTNWYGEEVLYESADDFDLYFRVETEQITQLKANTFANDLVKKVHSGAFAVNRQQFSKWAKQGGKQVESLKKLFSVLGIFPDPLQEIEDWE